MAPSRVPLAASPTLPCTQAPHQRTRRSSGVPHEAWRRPHVSHLTTSDLHVRDRETERQRRARKPGSQGGKEAAAESARAHLLCVEQHRVVHLGATATPVT